MTNTSEWPRASSKGESLVFFWCSKTLTCYPSHGEQVWNLLTQGGLPQLNVNQQAHKMGQSTLNTLHFQPISITPWFGEGKKEEKRKREGQGVHNSFDHHSPNQVSNYAVLGTIHPRHHHCCILGPHKQWNSITVQTQNLFSLLMPAPLQIHLTLMIPMRYLKSHTMRRN